MAIKRFLLSLLIIFYIVTFSNIIKGEEFVSDNQPFILIPEIIMPKIDGEMDDKEWSQGVGVSNFLLIDGSRLAIEQTFCYMGHDENNIYFALRMDEFALNPISNQAHEFKAELKGKHAHIWEDDSIEIRLSSPMNPLKVYYLGVNANAATYCVIIEYNHDGSLKKMGEWDPDIEVKTSINDGYWLAEAAIPFKDLGGYFETDKPGRLQIIRFEKRLEETSSWSTLSGSLLEIKKYGYFELSEDGPSIQFSGIPNISPGNNNISLTVSSPKKICGAVKVVVFKDNTAPAEYEKIFMVNVNESKLVTANCEISMPSRDWVQIFLYSDSGELLYKTKTVCYQKDDTSTKVPDRIIFEGEVDGKGKTMLYLNEKAISVNNQIKEILQQGLNLLAIHIPSDSKISGSFKIGDQLIYFDSTWRYTFNPDAGWEKAEYNDSKWGKFNPDLLNQSRDRDLYLRKPVLISASQIYPKFQDNTIYLSVGGAYGFQIHEEEVPNWNLNERFRDYKIYIDLPEGIELVGACSKTGRTYRVSPQYWKDKDIYSFHPMGEVKRGKEIYNRYVITRSGTVRFLSKRTREGIYNSCHIVIKALEETEKWHNNAEKQIYYRCEAENGYIQEIDNVLKVKVLPQLKGIPPKNIYITLGGAIRFFDFMADENMLLNLVDTLKSAGINEMQYWGHVDIPGKTGIPTYNFVIMGRSTNPPAENIINTTEVLDKSRERRHVNQSGRRNEGRICWDFILSNKEASDTLKKAVHAYCNRFPNQTTLFWDWEYPAFSKTRIQSVFSCFCDKCLEKFRQEKGIKEKVNVELIEQKYLEQWIDFQTSMLAKMMGLMSEAAHECGKQFTTYSSYHGQYTIEHYGFDYNKISPYVDRALAGYGRPVEAIEATKKALYGKPLIGGVLSIPVIPNVSSSAELLRRIIDCGGGVLCWWEDLYDARKLSEVAQASRFVSSYENFLIKGESVNDIITCPVDDIFEVRRYENKYLAICLNENKRPLTVPFKFTKAVKNVRDAETLMPLEVTSPMKTTIQGGDVKAFIFECKR